MDGFFNIGFITGAHGIKGDIKVFPVSDDPQRFFNLKRVTIECNGILSERVVLKTREQKNIVLLTLEGIDTMDEALKLKGGRLLIPREEARPLAEGEYYMADLYDIDVYSDAGEHLGVITDIMSVGGANDVYVVNDKIMLPAIKSCILNVDVANRKMIVHLMKGLLE